MTAHKPTLLVASIATFVAIAIVIFMVTSKEAAHKAMQTQINTILEKMECKDNSCDRYKGADAKRDFAAVNKRIEKLEEKCR